MLFQHGEEEKHVDLMPAKRANQPLLLGPIAGDTGIYQHLSAAGWAVAIV
jgi:hypothetical protein